MSLISRIASVPLLSTTYLFSNYLTLAIKICKSVVLVVTTKVNIFITKWNIDDILLGHYQKPALIN